MNLHKRIRQMIGVTLVVLFLVGCSTPAATIATSTETQPIRIVTPTPPLSPTTSPHPEYAPTPTLSSSVKDIHTLCLEIEGDLSETIAISVQSFLTEPWIDLQVWHLDEQPCDATLTIVLTAKALSKIYVPAWYTSNMTGGEQLCYNGAEVSGQMSLGLPGHASAHVFIIGKKPPSKEIGACLSKERAPIHEVWHEAIIDGLAHFWGPGVLVQAATYPQTLYGANPALVRQVAIEALKELSGKNFGENVDRWQQWWEGQASTEKPFELPIGTPSPTATSTATTQSGSITGLALYSNGEPATGIIIQLLEVAREDYDFNVPFIATDYSTTASADGHFTIYDVPPGKYLIDTGTEYKTYPGETGSISGYISSSNAIICYVESGKIIDVGTLITD